MDTFTSDFRIANRSSLALLGAALLLGPLACSRVHAPETQSPAVPAKVSSSDSEFAAGGPIGAPSPGRTEFKRKSAMQAQAEYAERPAEGMSAAEPSVQADLAPAEEESVAGWRMNPNMNTEAYDSITENGFVSVATAPLSTFSVDVDTASYSNMRRFVSQGTLPPPGAVRIEELVNYFDYEYEEPSSDQPFSVYTELSTAPWAEQHKLLHIGLKGRTMERASLPARNLVFLLDVSGSMNEPNKLPLLKRSLAALLETMGEQDTVSIVVYAGSSGMVLPPTSAHNQAAISEALERLEAGGSTNGSQGIELAYELAQSNFRKNGVNRVILATDGDFNVGTTNQSELIRLIEEKRESGVFLTVLGFGMGNYKDSTLEKLADHGNGNYAYIDSLNEARKVLVQEGGANLITIAKDVKIQIEMNPAVVGAYRLIGYENRMLQAEDFNDDRKDAGEIGAGHTVTALYEILSPAQAAKEVSVDELKYGQGESRAWQSPQGGWAGGAEVPSNSRMKTGTTGELLTIKLRYKAPQDSRSVRVEYPVQNQVRSPSQTSQNFRFSAAVASFGMLLHHSRYRGLSSFQMVQRLAAGALGPDEYGYRREFLGLVQQAQQL